MKNIAIAFAALFFELSIQLHSTRKKLLKITQAIEEYTLVVSANELTVNSRITTGRNRTKVIKLNPLKRIPYWMHLLKTW